MHRCYNSDDKGMVPGQGTYVACSKASENIGKDLVRGEKFIKERGDF